MISSYAGVAYRRWWMSIGGLLVGVLIGGLINLLIPRTYVTEALIFIVDTDVNASAESAYEGTLMSAQKTRSYVELLRSEPIGEAVAGRLGPVSGLNAENVMDMISASSSPETVLIEVSASDADPQRAQAVANAATVALIDLITRLEQSRDPTQPPAVEARIAKEARLPSRPAFPMPMLNLALGGLFGLLLGFGAAYASESRRAGSDAPVDVSANGRPVTSRLVSQRPKRPHRSIQRQAEITARSRWSRSHQLTSKSGGETRR
jgi:uncharacterized protein involved in exopolysaccharide biosynthesis